MFKHLFRVVMMVFVLPLIHGCVSDPKVSDSVQPRTSTLDSSVEEEPDACAIEWKGLADSRANTDLLGMIDGNNVLYPDLSGEIDRRISDALAIVGYRRPGAKVWGELVWAQVRQSISQLAMDMRFEIHKEGETATLLSITTVVKRNVITYEDRQGVRFVGSAIDETVEQFKSELQEVCWK